MTTTPPPSPAMTAADPRTRRQRTADLRFCRAVIRAHARSFSFASVFLPRRIRADVAIVYAYYRLLDDLVDCPLPGATVEAIAAELDGWEGWLLAGAPYEGGHAVRRALPEVIERRGIAVGDLLPVIRGLRADLVFSRPRTLDELEAYAFDVAGSVGLVMAGLLGAADPGRARPAAAALGSAMQLTNVCRDVAEDLDRGRIYLPLDVCAEAGAADEALWARRSTPAVRAAVALVAGRAADLYAQGTSGLDCLPRDVRLAIAVAARAYGGILDRLAERDHDVFRGRVATTRRTRWGMAVRLAAGRALPLRGA